MNYLWEESQFDTRLFGFKVAKILNISSSISLSEISNLVNELKKRKVKYATVRFEANNIELIDMLSKRSFYTVDIMLALEKNVDLKKKKKDNSCIKPATIEDIPFLKQIVKGGLFYHTRLYRDPIIKNSLADKLYKKWIENSVNRKNADEVYVYKKNKSLCGFITLKKDGHIPLIGVSKLYQGQGIASALLQQAECHFKKNNVHKMMIETQATNISALRSYIKYGFIPFGTFITLRWSDM